MSRRSFERAHQRKAAAERRREALKRRRAGLATGAAIGATVLFAPSAQAATFEVNTLQDGSDGVCEPDQGEDEDCTLREAVEDANATPGVDDEITFETGLSGEIVLTQDEIQIGYYSDEYYGTSQDALTIEGPGRTISVSGDANEDDEAGDGDSRIFNVQGVGRVEISGLTLTEGYSGGSGGAMFGRHNSDVTVVDSAITDSVGRGGGGGVFSNGELALTRTDLTGNLAPGSPGGAVGAVPDNPNSKYGGDAALTVTGGNFTDNESADGGAIAARDTLTITGSTISGNTSDNRGGGISQFGKYGGLQITDSVVSAIPREMAKVEETAAASSQLVRGGLRRQRQKCDHPDHDLGQ